MEKYSFILLFIICLTPFSITEQQRAEKLRKEQKPSDSLVQYLTKVAAKHQVLFLIDKRNDQMMKINEFTQKINRHVPSLIATSDKAEKIVTDCRHIGIRNQEIRPYLLSLTIRVVKILYSINTILTAASTVRKRNGQTTFGSLISPRIYTNVK